MEPVLAGSSPVRHPSMEDAAKWTATGLENQGMGNCRGTLREASYDSSIFHLSTWSRKARRCADNTEIGGVVPPWWIYI